MFELIIVGAGPAGLTAGLYAGRMGLKLKIIEKMLPGGQVLLTESIDNFPGFPGGIDSRKLIENLVNQVKELNLDIEQAEIKEIKKDAEFVIKTADGEDYKSKTIIIATGSQYKSLDIPGEDKLRNKGVSYCAICDAPLFKKREVVVIGGGNQAVEEALTLEKVAAKVTLIHRRDSLRAVKVLQEKLLSCKKIKVIWDSIPLEFQGDKKLESIKIKNVKSQKEEVLSAQGVFVSIGMKPNTDFVNDLIKLDDNGYVITDDDLATSVSGIFAGGDCRKKSLRQAITACSEGAICAYSAFQFLETKS